MTAATSCVLSITLSLSPDTAAGIKQTFNEHLQEGGNPASEVYTKGIYIRFFPPRRASMLKKYTSNLKQNK